MTVDDLRRIVGQGASHGRDSVMLKVYRKTPPTGARVRVMPGVTGDFACWNQDAHGTFAVCYVRLHDLHAALTRIDPTTPPICRHGRSEAHGRADGILYADEPLSDQWCEGPNAGRSARS